MCAVDCSQVLEMPANGKHFALKGRRVVEILRVATTCGNGKSSVFELFWLKDKVRKNLATG